MFCAGDSVGLVYGQEQRRGYGDGGQANVEFRLNFMFTLAAVATNVCALPVGTVLDTYGPRVCGVISAFLLALGSLLFAFAKDLPFDGFIPGYLFLALGGPFVFISSFQLSNAFPRYSGLILALLTGAFDSSSALFLVFRVIFEDTNGEFDHKKFFLVYLVVPAFILVVQLTLMPSQTYKTAGEVIKEIEEESHTPPNEEYLDEAEQERLREQRRIRRDSVYSEIQDVINTKDNAKHQEEDDMKNRRSGVWGVLHGYSASEQVRSWWFVLITLFTVVQMSRINYFVATIRPQYEYMLGSAALAEHVNEVFDIALPLGGVISIPFIGTILDRASTTVTLATLVVVATAIGILGAIPNMICAYLNIALFVVYRPFYYTAVSDYAAKVFGFATFGKVYGLIICLAGLFNFMQAGLDALTHRVFDNNPLPVNMILLAVAVTVGTSLVVFVEVKSRTIQRDLLEDEAEGARERLMPGANGEGNGYGTVN